MAKLLANSSYGKLIEVQAHDYLIAELFPMPRFADSERVCAGLASVFTACGPAADELEEGFYWGEDHARDLAKAHYNAERDLFQGDLEDRGPSAVGWYVEALTLTGCPVSETGLCSVAQYMQAFRSFKAGQFFMPLYAAQITGATSAMVGLMAACLGALQGDTDSVHVKLPEELGGVTEMPGYARYFEIMTKAGYPSPREAKKLGSWEEETPDPSTESLLARTKLYSHKFADGKYKQAQHGIAKFHSPEIDAVLSGRAYSEIATRRLVHGITREERGTLAKETRAVALHEAVRSLIVTGAFSYDAKRSPRRIKEAVARGLPVGEFISRPMDLVLAADPNTWRDAEGKVHWNPLKPGEKHWAPVREREAAE
jgi:hypothetical protein